MKECEESKESCWFYTVRAVEVLKSPEGTFGSRSDVPQSQRFSVLG